MREIRTSGLMSGERKRALPVPRLSSTLPARARIARKTADWRWSSARAHCAGKDAGGVPCLDVWRHLFGNPAVAAEAWTTFLEGPEEEVRRNAGRRAVPYNRVAWSVPVVTLGAGSIFLALVARSQLIPCTVALCNHVVQPCGSHDGLCGCPALACPTGLRLCFSPNHAWYQLGCQLGWRRT